ncbi:aa3-type cytochrome c oxidase subunit IV [Govanella unica]|uniref:Aa3-type cytochrome c oxidase subunit IV n=1 Tax=Govanella unica TaxID=2975056 RepID=A0A9X3U0G6_9PROT|nr:aa3-type cytochrome c oxidase subunit IV [Govania unica]MDA5194873.1 aa3-type cytochrome c oxidase subunit IV [Govania unica]
MTNHGSMDMPAHRHTYAGFVKLLTIVSISVAAILVIMAITLI